MDDDVKETKMTDRKKTPEVIAEQALDEIVGGNDVRPTNMAPTAAGAPSSGGGGGGGMQAQLAFEPNVIAEPDDLEGGIAGGPIARR